MPSRNSNIGKSKRVKHKVARVIITPEKAPKKKLEVNVNENSLPGNFRYSYY
jgi:hypothetical protein